MFERKREQVPSRPLKAPIFFFLKEATERFVSVAHSHQAGPTTRDQFDIPYPTAQPPMPRAALSVGHPAQARSAERPGRVVGRPRRTIRR